MEGKDEQKELRPETLCVNRENADAFLHSNHKNKQTKLLEETEQHKCGTNKLNNCSPVYLFYLFCPSVVFLYICLSMY